MNKAVVIIVKIIIAIIGRLRAAMGLGGLVGAAAAAGVTRHNHAIPAKAVGGKGLGDWVTHGDTPSLIDAFTNAAGGRCMERIAAR
ncbi:hypothetical protein [Acidocella aminolytica]|nr:hypothetical protein [Acidocella aminolytica]